MWQKLRGLAGIALAWAVLWTIVMTVIGVIIGIVDPDSIDPGESPFIIGAMFGLIGLVSGLAFDAILSLAERGRELRDVALIRAATWGLLASAVFPLAAGKADQVLVCCPLGALTGMAIVALARRIARPIDAQAG